MEKSTIYNESTTEIYNTTYWIKWHYKWHWSFIEYRSKYLKGKFKYINKYIYLLKYINMEWMIEWMRKYYLSNVIISFRKLGIYIIISISSSLWYSNIYHNCQITYSIYSK